MTVGRAGSGPPPQDRPSGDRPPPGPGTLALDAHVAAADGGPPEHRWYPQPSRALPGQGPLEQVVGRRVGDHWHLVTYGLSELDAKESEDPATSGWGFELTLRVEVDPADDRSDGDDPVAGDGLASDPARAASDPARRGRRRGRIRKPAVDDRPGPAWAVDLLANLAAYVWTSRHPFAPGHHLALGGPIRLDTDSLLTAAAVVEDPGLGPLRSPFGRVEFLQVVGLTGEELERCRSWSTEGVLDLLAERDPLLVTRLHRPSLLDDPAVAAQIEARSATDGAALTELRVGTLDCIRKPGRGSVIRMGAGTASALGPALRRELIGADASFRVVGDESEVRFAVGEPSWRTTGDGIDIEVALSGVDNLARLFDGRTGWGRLPELRGLRFHVIP